MPTHRSVNQPLIASARAMAEAAGKAKDVFLQHGLAPDFIERMQEAATTLEGTRMARVESARRRVTATAAVKDQLKRGRKAVRLLNAILAPRLAKDPELVAAWESARRARSFGPSQGDVIEPLASAAPSVAGTAKAA